MAAKKRKQVKRKRVTRVRQKKEKSLIDSLNVRPRTKRRIKAVTKSAQILAVILLGLLLYPLFKPAKKKPEQPQPKATINERLQTHLRQATAPPRAQSKRVWSSKPKLVFVIDDIGHNLSAEKELLALGRNVTYAILPFLQHSHYFSGLSRNTGAEVILHLPMQASDDTIPGPGLITSSMPEDYLRNQVNRNLNSVPHRLGVNNHMGSGGTQDPELMRIILEELQVRNLFFLDSMTSGASVGWRLGRQMGMSTLRRDVFLDNVDERAAIREQVRVLARVARQRGYAVGIGHFRTNTLAILLEEIPELKREGYEVISLSELLDFQSSR